MLIYSHHAVEVAQGKMSQVAVATRKLWEAAGSRRRQQKVVGGNRKLWEATESRGRQQEFVEDTKVKPSSGPSTSVWQNPETSAFTSQSEISPTPLSFLWCSFRVKRIVFIT